YNYRIDEIRAALGLVQLDKLAGNNARRQALTQRYWQALESAPLELPFCNLERTPEMQPAYHIFPALLPDGVDRKAFIDQLRAAGVQTSIHYPPIHQFSYYRQRCPGVSLPRTEAVARREITLPLYPGMDAAAFELVVETVKAALRQPPA
ncbi:MAG: DegT/DnrJ/EryC1/StrS family aminotransferase, partial [Chloroflexota bacterium]